MRAGVAALLAQVAELKAEVGCLRRRVRAAAPSSPPAEAAMDCDLAQSVPRPVVGARCRLVGLVAAAELNGRVCEVITEVAADERVGVVALPVRGMLFPDVVVAPERKVRVRLANLVVIDETPD